MLLFLISFIAGVLTVLAPCVLPLLPVVVGGSLSTGSRRRAYVICLSLGGSVVVFTLLLKATTALIGVPQSFWEIVSGGIIVLFGIVLLFPSLWDSLPLVNRLNRGSNKLLATGYRQNSLSGDMLMGAALGPIFTSCSPTYFIVLATVLPASFAAGLADLLAYAAGLAGFLFVIALAGQTLVDTLGVAIEPGGWFRRAIGILFVIVGVAVATGAEARTEAWLLDHGFDITVIEQQLLKGPAPAQCSGNECVGTSTSFLTPAEKARELTRAPELVSPDGYINTDTNPDGSARPITIAQFRGKDVVLIDFWTYSCINCARTIPYVEGWYQKYKDEGLMVIGVHTPEFAFEHVYQNVALAVQRLGITYPVVQDNEYRTWNAFGNEYWPREYLIDIDGYIVHDHAGEGDYAATEAAIQKALAERTSRLGLSASSSSTTVPSNAVPIDYGAVGSPETYFGSNRNEYLANGTQGQVGAQTLTIPASGLRGNALYLGGMWDFEKEYATNKAAVARIIYVYDAKNVYIVAAAANSPVKIKVTRDGGKPLGAARGADVNAQGFATVSADRLYQLVGDSSYGVHTLELQIESPGLEAYTFTFG